MKQKSVLLQTLKGIGGNLIKAIKIMSNVLVLEQVSLHSCRFYIEKAITLASLCSLIDANLCKRNIVSLHSKVFAKTSLHSFSEGIQRHLQGIQRPVQELLPCS